MAASLNRIHTIIGRQFKDPTILTEALQAAGSEIRYAGVRAIPDGNKRLAILGDSVLKLALLGPWYQGGSSRGSGDIIIQRLVSNSNLSMIGSQNGLEAYINPNPGQRGMIISEKTMATAVEALLGAAWHDSGHDINAVNSVMRALGLEYTSGSPTSTNDGGLNPSLPDTMIEEPTAQRDEKI